MTATASPGRPAKGLLRVGVYYAILIGLTFALVRYVPVVRDAVSGGSLSGLGGPGASEIFGVGAPPAVGQEMTSSTWYNAILASVSMLGALAIMMPVTWVYMITRGRRGYEESVVHTLLILPVAVTGIVMIVKGSVPLAFSLAGIVAAVRFRTTLDDTKDAVYVFLAIGVGLASGVQAVGVALALSLIFNAVVLVLWRTGFGDGLAEAAAGPAALGFGDAAKLEPSAASSAVAAADRAGGLAQHIAEERSREKGKRANSLVLVHTESAQAAQRLVEPLLDRVTGRWKLAEVTPADDGFVLSYLVRLDGDGAQGALLDGLHPASGGTIGAVELRSLKGINPGA